MSHRRQAGPTKRRRVPFMMKQSRDIVIAVAFVLAVTAFLFVFVSRSPAPAVSLCVNHTSLAYHWHAILKVFVVKYNNTTNSNDALRVVVPPNVGIIGACLHPLHTHLADGIIHIESPDANTRFTIGDFFQEWHKPFNPDRMVVGSVDRPPNPNLVLENDMAIVLYYKDNFHG